MKFLFFGNFFSFCHSVSLWPLSAMASALTQPRLCSRYLQTLDESASSAGLHAEAGSGLAEECAALVSVPSVLPQVPSFSDEFLERSGGRAVSDQQVALADLLLFGARPVVSSSPTPHPIGHPFIQGGCRTGEVKLTGAYALPARYCTQLATHLHKVACRCTVQIPDPLLNHPSSHGPGAPHTSMKASAQLVLR